MPYKRFSFFLFLKDPQEKPKENGNDSTSSHSDLESSVMLVEEDIDPFLVEMIKFLLSIHDANNDSVRYRVCQMINRILNSMFPFSLLVFKYNKLKLFSLLLLFSLFTLVLFYWQYAVMILLCSDDQPHSV